MKKLTYWVAHDREGYTTPYTIREKSKKKVLQRLKELSEETQFYYCEPKRVVVFYDNPLDLINRMSGEDNCWWENQISYEDCCRQWLPTQKYFEEK